MSDFLNMPKDEFCARFVAEMMKAAPIYEGTEAELREYAEGVAESYWSTDWQREIGPEECAGADIGYWEPSQ